MTLVHCLKHTVLLMIISWLISCSMLYALEPGVTTVIVTGTGKVVNDNDLLARNDAIENGLISAAERVVPDFISTHLMIQNFQFISKIIHDEIDQFIGTYKVLVESRIGKKYRVLMEVNVYTMKIKQKLELAGIVDQKELPKVLCLLSEKNLEDLKPQYWWENKDTMMLITTTENAFSETLQNKGFEIVGPKSREILFNTNDSELSFSNKLSSREILDIGRKLNAGVVVYGEASVQASNLMGDEIRSFNGTMHLDVYRLDPENKLTTVQLNAGAMNTDELMGSREVLVKVSEQTAEKVATEITNAWEKETNEPTLIEVVIKGQHYLRKFVKLRRVFNEMTGIKRIQTREMQSDRAVILLDYLGTAKELANQLILKSFETFAIKISEVTSMRLTIEFIEETP